MCVFLCLSCFAYIWDGLTRTLGASLRAKSRTVKERLINGNPWRTEAGGSFPYQFTHMEKKKKKENYIFFLTATGQLSPRAIVAVSRPLKLIHARLTRGLFHSLPVTPIRVRGLSGGEYRGTGRFVVCVTCRLVDFVGEGGGLVYKSISFLALSLSVPKRLRGHPGRDKESATFVSPSHFVAGQHKPHSINHWLTTRTPRARGKPS